jgi:hypothetical protein
LYTTNSVEEVVEYNLIHDRQIFGSLFLHLKNDAAGLQEVKVAPELVKSPLLLTNLREAEIETTDMDSECETN